MQDIEHSEKSYGVAVCLAGIFGILGIHHFYLGNVAHGLFDLCLSILGFGLIIFSLNPTLIIVGIILILIDFIHSFYVFYKLIVGEWHDEDGKLVTYKK